MSRDSEARIVVQGNILSSILIITPWFQSASDLYRQSNRRLSAKLVPTFANRGATRDQRGETLSP
jgi:hypothetical protein